MTGRAANGLTVRQVAPEDHATLRAVQALMQTVWGAPDVDLVPVDLFTATLRAGGHVTAAQAEDQLVGFVYGFPGLADKEVYLHSHMLAVHPAWRRRGVARRLKEAQRDWARSTGRFRTIRWTFDPLLVANARLNLNTLGSRAVRYDPDAYGPLDDALNRGMPTDRFWVVWDVEEPCAHRAAPHSEATLKPPAAAPVSGKAERWALPWLLGWREGVHTPDAVEPDASSPVTLSKPYAGALYVAVPTDIRALRADPARLLAWRAAHRAAFAQAFAQGYAACAVRPVEGAPAVHAYELWPRG